MDKPRIEEAVKEIIVAIGEDPEREGLLETPARVARMFEEVFGGLEKDPSIHAKKIFHESNSELVLVKDIEFSSMCEHHFLPFYGKGHIAYIPRDGRVVGLSKLARILEDVSKRPQMQERITNDVCDILMDTLDPDGVMVVLEGDHMCMNIRGVKKPGSQTVTKATRGVFKENYQMRKEILDMINM